MTTRTEHQPAQIPVTLIGGFLGAGKTTLLNTRIGALQFSNQYPSKESNDS